jgi:hypothetical protein
MCVETVNPRPLARSGPKESYTTNAVFRALDLIYNTVAVAAIGGIPGLGRMLPDHRPLSAVGLITSHAGPLPVQEINAQHLKRRFGRAKRPNRGSVSSESAAAGRPPRVPLAARAGPRATRSISQRSWHSPICRAAAEGPDPAGVRVLRRGLRQCDPTSHLRNGRGAPAIGLRRRQVSA